MKLRNLTILAGLALSSACVSVLPEPKAAQGLYRLGDAEPTVMLSRNLIVREPEGGRVFGGRALAAEGADGAVRLINGVEWMQGAARMLQTRLIDTFGTEGGGVAMAKGIGAPGDLELAWRMSDFTISGLMARCQLELTLLDGRTREPLMRRRVTAQADARSAADGDRAQALAEAGRACVQETAEIIAAVDASLGAAN